jgi:hypothetical protein
VNFTREPIIETIISPKEGCKLLVRSSRGGTGAEEYYVDAVEVVSFGRAFFFRSLERPKAFLLPVSDYEVLEVKETRVALKNVSHERNIKIGGGREARHSHREPPQEREQEQSAAEEAQEPAAEETGLETAIGQRMDKRRDRRRRRHRRSSDDQEWTERRQQQQPAQEEQQSESSDTEEKAQGGGAEDEAKVSSAMFSSLIPPPTTLISETIGRYKDKEFMEGASSKEVEEQKEKEHKHKKESPTDDEEPTGSESSPLNRISTAYVSEHLELRSNFSGLPDGNNPYSF